VRLHLVLTVVEDRDPALGAETDQAVVVEVADQMVVEIAVVEMAAEVVTMVVVVDMVVAEEVNKRK